MSTTLNIRIGEDIKKEAGDTLARLGLDMSTAVKMFLNQVIIEKGIPFISTTNPASLNAKWDKQIQYALKNGKKYNSAKDMLDDIL